MTSDLVRFLCALAAFTVPLGIAWLVVRWQASHGNPGDRAAADPKPRTSKA